MMAPIRATSKSAEAKTNGTPKSANSFSEMSERSISLTLSLVLPQSVPVAMPIRMAIRPPPTSNANGICGPLIRFGTGEEVTVQAGEEGIRFLLISGAPIEEPVAWHGPIVMNTQEELRQAMADLRNGTFIRPAH